MKSSTRRAGACAVLIAPVLAAAAPVAQAAPFTPGNVVVVRVGDGTGLHPGSTGDPAFLDEYSATGTLVQSIQLPDSGAGDQRPLILSGTGIVGVAGSEGQITRSADGRSLAVAGYGRSVGGTGSLTLTNPTTIPRVIARVAAGGAVDTSTALTDFGGTSGSAPRGVATADGSQYWITGAIVGTAPTGPPIRHAAHGATTSTPISTTITTTGGLRGAGIFDNQLYVTSVNTTPAMKLGTVGVGLPTTPNQTIMSLSSTIESTATTPNGFVFLDLEGSVAGADTLYVADEQAVTSNTDGVIRKYSFDGTTWTARGTATATDVRGLTATTTAGTVTLFGSSGGGTTTGCPANCQLPPTGGGALYKLNDTTGHTGTLTGAATTIATPPTGTGFRGVALAPELPPDAPPAHSPTCTGTTAQTPYETAVTLTIACTDADGDDVSRRAVDGPAKGTLGAFDNSTGTVTYTPKRGATGRDTFTIAGGDGDLESEPVPVTVDIGPAPPAPPLPPPNGPTVKPPMGVTLATFKRSTRAITFKVTCTAGGALDACRGRLRVELTRRTAGLKRLGGVQFEIRSGTTRTLRLGLSRSIRRKLAGRTLELRIAGWVRQANRARPTALTAATTTLKPPAR